MSSARLITRSIADVLVGICAAAGFVVASHHSESTANWLIVVGCLVFFSAIVSGYYERSVRWVWIHAPLIMLPELIALPIAVLTCRGHGCAGFIAFLMLASLLTFVLIGLSFVGFFIRRWLV